MLVRDFSQQLDTKSCAVCLTFDNFGESFDLLRYQHAGGAHADGVYAPRRGVPRILELLDQYHIPATFFVEGWNIGKYPSLAKEIVVQGHELGAHGWMHETWNELCPSDERELIERTTSSISDVVGYQPLGWRSPSGLTTPSTLRFIHELGYQYDSSHGDDDVPYVTRVANDSDAEVAELPWTWSLDDAAYFAYPGTIRNPREVLDIWIDEFEAARKLTGYFMLVCHPRFTGRPSRIGALEQLIRHIKGTPGVWFARCHEVADEVRAGSSTRHYLVPESL